MITVSLAEAANWNFTDSGPLKCGALIAARSLPLALT